jgi:hypothetical protein
MIVMHARLGFGVRKIVGVPLAYLLLGTGLTPVWADGRLVGTSRASGGDVR